MDLETKYKTFIVDYQKRTEVKSNGVCVASGSNVCFCEAFLNADSEGPCAYGTYSKTLRDKEELARYVAGPSFKDKVK
jgi:hypothetical protein